MEELMWGNTGSDGAGFDPSLWPLLPKINGLIMIVEWYFCLHDTQKRSLVQKTRYLP